MKEKYPVWKTLGRMLSHAAREDKPLFVMCLAYTLIAACYPFIAVLLPRVMVGELTRAGGGRAREVIVIAGGYLLIAGLIGFFRELLSGLSYPRITRLRIDYLRDICRKITEMAYPNCEDATFMERNDRAINANNSNDNGVEAVYQSLFKLPATALTILILAVLIGLKSPLILFGLILNVLATVFALWRTHAFEYQKKEEVAHAIRRLDYNQKITHDFAYGKDIRLYSLRARVKDNFLNEIKGYIAVFGAIRKKEYRLSLLTLLALIVGDCLTYGLLTLFVTRGMSIAEYSMYIAAAAALSLNLKTFAEESAKILAEGQYVCDFYRFMDEDMGEKGGDTQPVREGALRIEFKDVSFKYPGTERYILNHLNLTIEKGQRLAIVGVNGAGKTTIVKLMTGLFAPTSGEILINGVPIEKYDKRGLYSMFACVFQDVSAMAFTVCENVACREGADRERVETALREAGLWEKVDSFDQKIDQPLLKVIEPDGAMLSGGETQKLAIARALYKGGPAVIMDEPTAALDALAESAIYERMAEMTRGRTAVYISHRLASTQFCDEIAFFDQEGLREYGTHQELMDKRGEYYHMFTVQGKYYQEGGEKDEEAADA